MKITLLTKPFSSVDRLMKETERLFNYYKYKLSGNRYRAWTCTFKEGGHQDVTTAIIKGASYFREVELFVNPSRREALGSVVYVPSGWRALRDAIDLKRAGLIPYLIAGPTVCDLPHMHGYILADQAIDCCLVASEWVKELFIAETRDISNMNICIWAAGIDTDYWRPLEDKPHNFRSFTHVLIYIKKSGVKMLAAVSDLMSSAGIKYRLLYNEAHTPEDYKTELEMADCVVVLGESETQGLAIAQAWAMDIPTFVYDSDVISEYHRNFISKTKVKASCAPYLCCETGRFWRNIDDLKECLTCAGIYYPRRWVLANQTYKIAFAKFLEIGGIKNIK